jgi:multidrug resistance efflux pump
MTLGILLVTPAIVVAGILGTGWYRSQEHHALLVLESSAAAQEEAESPAKNAISVKTITPHRDPSFTVSIEQPAYVSAYYRADLLAKVAGPVSTIAHDIGDRVQRGEPLVEIEVPDLREDVLLKEALIVQEQKELELAQSREKMAQIAVRMAEQAIPLKQSEVDRKDATLRFRAKELKRYQSLGGGPSPGVTQDVIDERTEFYEAAVAASAEARQAVKEAQLDFEESKAKLEAAAADVAKRRAMIGVACKDRDKARALASFTTITAPFDGVITQRHVDPGSFVQNAATAHAEPLLSVARTDIVTVYMKVPDKFAPFVTTKTDALIEMDSLPGVIIRAKVTRFSGSLENTEHDRTMRAEVDLYNGDPQQYPAFAATEAKQHNVDLKSHKLPLLPKINGQDEGRALGLLPGEYGKMRLVLRSFRKDYLLPCSAVFSEGGTSYVFLVKNGHAFKTPVEIQADNGEKMSVILLVKNDNEQEHLQLTGAEEVITSNQGELSDGQAVKSTLVDW